MDGKRFTVSVAGYVVMCLGAVTCRPALARVVEQPGPRGRVVQGVFESSTIFPGTRREWSVYVPAEYSGDEPARLMVFQDGPAYSKADGSTACLSVRRTDREGRDAVTIAFATPGTIRMAGPGARIAAKVVRYDSLGDRLHGFSSKNAAVALEC